MKTCKRIGHRISKLNAEYIHQRLMSLTGRMVRVNSNIVCNLKKTLLQERNNINRINVRKERPKTSDVGGKI